MFVYFGRNIVNHLIALGKSLKLVRSSAAVSLIWWSVVQLRQSGQFVCSQLLIYIVLTTYLFLSNRTICSRRNNQSKYSSSRSRYERY